MIESKHIQIVEGALKLFFAQGFHPTTIREIAESCNMSMGQLYHYISSKDDVLYLVHKYFHQLRADFIKAQNIEQYATPMERLIKYLEASMIFVSENKKLIQLISTETKYLRKEYLKEVLQMEQEDTIDNYYQLLADLNKEIPINGDLEVLASILAYLVAFFSLKGWTVNDKSTDDVNRCLFNFIFNGLGQDVLNEYEKSKTSISV
ncbi:TetR/AcrR family transcriptional regulator [Sporomusa acidovorans]|uniref:HTH tetR-type domain-containing protein n=1 Tax=Sporomusa acidovorans (strain ATCC 49682 / DSM 3132 / Mol) TaxID=1123286 RepID=A0ABZ3J059_SPOA4|nr:TetR/AcrR family transcriptional regulator [Sporomusa acidovorans]OZC21983.1 HTH-type transcriptional regulator BetI [Sporomusa acidovorans DSM 3132]SDF64866.1 transcriptional regulator, TetR family [Sporomusa acidovorans]